MALTDWENSQVRFSLQAALSHIRGAELVLNDAYDRDSDHYAVWNVRIGVGNLGDEVEEMLKRRFSNE